MFVFANIRAADAIRRDPRPPAPRTMLFNSLVFVVFFALVLSGLLEPALLGGEEEPAPGGELHLLRRVEPAVRPSPLLDDGARLLPRKPHRRRGEPWDAQGLDVRERHVEPEHPELLQVRELRAREHPLAPRPSRHRLQPAAHGCLPADRDLLLHLPLAFLHPRRLPRGVRAHAVAARLHAGGVLLPAARGRPDRARCRLPPAARVAADAAPEPVQLGPSA